MYHVWRGFLLRVLEAGGVLWWPAEDVALVTEWGADAHQQRAYPRDALHELSKLVLGPIPLIVLLVLLASAEAHQAQFIQIIFIII